MFFAFLFKIVMFSDVSILVKLLNIAALKLMYGTVRYLDICY